MKRRWFYAWSAKGTPCDSCLAAREHPDLPLAGYGPIAKADALAIGPIEEPAPLSPEVAEERAKVLADVAEERNCWLPVGGTGDKVLDAFASRLHARWAKADALLINGGK